MALTRKVPRGKLIQIKSGKMSFHKSCGKKHAYSQGKAIRVAARQREKSGEAIYPYLCVFGDHYHIGHTRRNK